MLNSFSVRYIELHMKCFSKSTHKLQNEFAKKYIFINNQKYLKCTCVVTMYNVEFFQCYIGI